MINTLVCVIHNVCLTDMVLHFDRCPFIKEDLDGLEVAFLSGKVECGGANLHRDTYIQI